MKWHNAAKNKFFTSRPEAIAKVSNKNFVKPSSARPKFPPRLRAT